MGAGRLLPRPVARALERAAPAVEQRGALVFAHVRFEATVLAPQLPRLGLGPEPCRHAREVGGAQRRGLADLRDDDRHPEDVGLERVTLAQLGVGDPVENARVAESVLAGEAGPLRDMVVLNAAAGLVVGDVAPDLPSAVLAAAAAIDNGSAARVLGRLVAVSRAASADPED